jgi:hypothetical protein
MKDIFIHKLFNIIGKKVNIIVGSIKNNFILYFGC